MPVSKFALNRRHKHQNSAGNPGKARVAQPFIRNEPGFRYERDQSKGGLEVKKVPR